MDLDSLKRLAKIACDAAISSGAEAADVSARWDRGLNVEIRSNAIGSCDVKLGGGISVRAIYNGGAGWSSASKLAPDSAAQAGRNAARLARLAEPDPYFVSLPHPAEAYPEVPGLADPALAEMEAAEIVEYSLRSIDDALAVCPDAVVEGGFSAAYDGTVIVNSLGVCLGRECSFVGGHTMVVIRRGGEVGSFYDFDSARMLADFSPEGIGARTAEQALRFLGARTIETKRMPIVLGPLASGSVFDGIVANADAENIQRGRSFMIGKLGEKIAPDLLTLTDDPLIPRGLSSRPYDYEGFPCKPLVVMENGVLKSYLYSSYSAGKAGVANTGHGTPGGNAIYSNIVPKLGDMTADEIVQSIDEGIYINMGGIGPNPVTGDVSSAIDFGFKIEAGELAYPVSSSMVGEKFLDMVSNIDAISSDYRQEPGMVMPTVRIQDVLVAGAK